MPLPGHSDKAPMSRQRRCAVASVEARRAGPREHGRQAARSKRDRPGRASELVYQLSHLRAGAAGALIS